MSHYKGAISSSPEELHEVNKPVVQELLYFRTFQCIELHSKIPALASSEVAEQAMGRHSTAREASHVEQEGLSVLLLQSKATSSLQDIVEETKPEIWRRSYGTCRNGFFQICHSEVKLCVLINFYPAEPSLRKVRKFEPQHCGRWAVLAQSRRRAASGSSCLPDLETH